MPYQLPVETVTLRHTYRVGACPVLEVTVTYPRIPETANPAAPRFNEAYRSMADHFLTWAEGAPAEASKAAFVAMGGAAPYRFDRRLLTCAMTPAPAAEEGKNGQDLLILRTVTRTSRRGEMPPAALTATDRWRLPELTLRPASRRRSK